MGHLTHGIMSGHKCEQHEESHRGIRHLDTSDNANAVQCVVFECAVLRSIGVFDNKTWCAFDIED